MNKKLAKAFNEWMRRYTEEPGKFQQEFESVGAFLKEQAAGVEPSYGANCAAYIDRILAEI